MTIDWEFPPKSFAVGLSEDGVTWTEIFATDSNVLASTSLPLGLARASQLRIVMHEACLFVYVSQCRVIFSPYYDRPMHSMASSKGMPCLE